jgi:hypothetical protein
MTVKKAYFALGLISAASLASPLGASGFRAPAHSQMTYSFTCPSGASGHVSYTKDFDQEPTSRLTIWVNGKYIHEAPHIAAQLKVRNIEKVGASCEGDNTLVYLQTFDPSREEGKGLKVVYLQVNRAGEVSPSDG